MALAKKVDEGGLEYDEMKTRVTGELKKVFRPEFLNRVDETIVFRKLTREEIGDIVELMLARVEEQLKDREIGLALTPEAKALLVDVGFDPDHGRASVATGHPASRRRPAGRRGSFRTVPARQHGVAGPRG